MVRKKKKTGKKSKKISKEVSKEKIVQQRITRKRVKKLTDGLFGSLVDLTLFSLFLPLSSFGHAASSRGVYETFKETDEALAEFNYQHIKRSLTKLKEQGLIESFKSWTNEPMITLAGKKRLKNLLPVYQEKRPWDGKIYLVNYDISSKQNYLRNRLRDLLEKLGGFEIQDSLYLIANNPYQFVQEFIKENNPDGLILISELGKQGFVGEDSLKDFIWVNAGLEKINDRYNDFIGKWKDVKGGFSKTAVAIDYYSILQNDPQLPFKILSDDYSGDEAYLLFQKLIKVP